MSDLDEEFPIGEFLYDRTHYLNLISTLLVALIHASQSSIDSGAGICFI